MPKSAVNDITADHDIANLIRCGQNGGFGILVTGLLVVGPGPVARLLSAVACARCGDELRSEFRVLVTSCQTPVPIMS